MHDHAAPAGDHRFSSEPRQPDSADQIGRDQPLGILPAVIEQRLVHQNACVVDEHISTGDLPRQPLHGGTLPLVKSEGSDAVRPFPFQSAKSRRITVGSDNQGTEFCK